ncbi:DUF2303 family protein, partial [Escherichia coli]|uniref:DUF2303 family protein n=1 Tax=Escherichia coli TaxID=562 RepID=UPI001FA9A1D3
YNSKRPHKALALMTPVEYILKENKNCNMWWTHTEAKTKDIMPVAFEFKCVPFEGLKERPFKLRLSIITGDHPVLVLRIIQLEAVQEEMANEFRDLLVEKFKDSKVETFIGTFTA